MPRHRRRRGAPSDRPEEIIQLRIDDLAGAGDGVGRQRGGARDGRAVFVPHTAPGDLVEVRLLDQRRRLAHGEVVELLERGPARVDPPCSLHGLCGGCGWQHLDPAAQREHKRRHAVRQIKALLRRHQPVAEASADDVVVGPAPAPMVDWRRRLRLRLRRDRDAVRLGLFARRSHRLVDVTHCLVAVSPLNAALASMREPLLGLAPGAGGSLVMQSGDDGAVTASLRLSPGSDDPGALAAALQEAAGLSGVVVRVGAEAARVGVARCRRSAPASGARIVVDHPIDGFSQAHGDVADDVVAAVVDGAVALIGDLAGRSVVDLFAGSGLLSLPLAAAGARVDAVEVDAAAVAALRDNASAAGRADVRARTGDLFARDGATAALAGAPDLVVIDPPREGARAVTEALVALSAPPAVVSVSCALDTHLRDIGVLLGAGYRLRRFTLFEMFPHSPGTESVAWLGPPEGSST